MLLLSMYFPIPVHSAVLPPPPSPYPSTWQFSFYMSLGLLFFVRSYLKEEYSWLKLSNFCPKVSQLFIF